tara:strand:- start:79 stop:1161 length:1083 start_codon:yes stop_codon:yes gene_type:complete
MSEAQVQETEMDAEVLETEDEDLLEFKASLGDESEVPEPTAKKADEKKKGKGDPMPKLSTKAGMINAAVQAMSKMKKEDLKSTYGKMFNEDSDLDEVEVLEDENAPRALTSITSADIDISEDVDAIFNGSELTEDHKEKIQTVFEAAVVAKVNEEIAKFAIEVESDAEATNVGIVDELTEKVDSYLDYVVQEWVEENKLAIETGVRADMVEDFLHGLKDLFTEHYVDVPEEKVDVVEELISKVDELESKLNHQIDENVELSSQVKSFTKESVFAESTDELTASQVEKLRGLAEGIEYDSAELFAKKISMLKAQYFNVIDEEVSTVIVDDENDPVALEEEKIKPTGPMANYLEAITRSVTK